jgi:hypothetical protein
MYPAENLESALRQVFSEDMVMSDSSYDKTIGVKIIITVTTAKRSEPCIFTNYQGLGNRPLNCGKCLSSTLYEHMVNEQAIMLFVLKKVMKKRASGRCKYDRERPWVILIFLSKTATGE